MGLKMFCFGWLFVVSMVFLFAFGFVYILELYSLGFGLLLLFGFMSVRG